MTNARNCRTLELWRNRKQEEQEEDEVHGQQQKKNEKMLNEMKWNYGMLHGARTFSCSRPTHCTSLAHSLTLSPSSPCLSLSLSLARALCGQDANAEILNPWMWPLSLIGLCRAVPGNLCCPYLPTLHYRYVPFPIPPFTPPPLPYAHPGLPQPLPICQLGCK